MTEIDVAYPLANGKTGRGMLFVPPKVQQGSSEAAIQKPLILLAHAWNGRNEFVIEKAYEWAAEGYPSFCLDMYGDAKVAQDKDECAALMGELLEKRPMVAEQMQQGLDAASQACLDAGLQYSSENAVAIGYCFGGLCVLDMFRDRLKESVNKGRKHMAWNALQGVASVHGLLQTPTVPKMEIKETLPRVLSLHGYRDPMVSPEDLMVFYQEMHSYGHDWQCHVFGDSYHAFTNPQANDLTFGTVYNKSADLRSTAILRDFASEYIG